MTELKAHLHATPASLYHRVSDPSLHTTDQKTSLEMNVEQVYQAGFRRIVIRQTRGTASQPVAGSYFLIKRGPDQPNTYEVSAPPGYKG